MKVFADFKKFSVPSSRQKGLNFKGTPLRIPQRNIVDYSDALKSWEYLRSAKYLDVHDDAKNWMNKYIRKDNYSFLDKLTSYYDKSQFVEKFCEFTGFPYLRKTSNNIHNTFISSVKAISSRLNSNSYDNSYKILDAGYDPTCSLGLKKAFPGSDLDKGYVIIKGTTSDYQNENIVNNFKGELWENLDQRIVSLNHPNTAVDVYTEKQVKDNINWLDKIVKRREEEINKYLGAQVALGLAALIIGGPAVLIGYMLRNKYQLDHKTDPYIAAKFNRKLTDYIHTSSEREKAKNFAFFIETVRENSHLTDDFYKNEPLFKDISNSCFVSNSNVTQIPAWREKISEGYLKNKLVQRENLERDFYSMSTDTKYELVKDIIKYSSNDQSDRFKKYFVNDDDISKRYEKLLNALK